MDVLGPIPVHKNVTSPWLHQPLNQILGEYPRWQEWTLLCQEQWVHSRTRDLIPPSSLQNTLATATKPSESSKVWENGAFLWIAALSLLFQSWSHIQRLSTPSLGGSAIQEAPGNLAGSGASSCALKKVMRTLLVFNGKRISPALLPPWKELCLPWDIRRSQGFHNAGKASPGFST